MTPEERFVRANQLELELCREAVRSADYIGAQERLTNLHWFAHDDPAIHSQLHRLELEVARKTGNKRAARSRILPVMFAGIVARLERLAPRYYAEALIDASPAVTYEVITDFARYPEWNPWLTAAVTCRHRVRPATGAAALYSARSFKRICRVWTLPHGRASLASASTRTSRPTPGSCGKTG